MLQCSTWSNCRSLYRRLSSGNGRPGCCWSKVLSAGKLEGQLDPVWWLETAGEIGACLGAPKSLPFHTLTTIIKLRELINLELVELMLLVTLSQWRILSANIKLRELLLFCEVTAVRFRILPQVVIECCFGQLSGWWCQLV